MYPLYIVLFSGKTSFSKLIKKVTGSEYSHATISLDPSLNSMYSFQKIPLDRTTFGYGFVRESIYGPTGRNCDGFSVNVIYLTKKQMEIIKEKIEYFIHNYDKFRYNTIGLIQYYLKFKSLREYTEETKRKFFCSEFVAYMLSSVGESDKNLLISPNDILKNNKINILGSYNVENFSSRNLIAKTKSSFDRLSTATESAERPLEIPNILKNFNSLIQTTSIVTALRKNTEYKSKIGRYTSFLDWKSIYENFKKLFPTSNPDLRFDLVEVLLLSKIIPYERNPKDSQKSVISEMKLLQNRLEIERIVSIHTNYFTMDYKRKGKNQFFKFSSLS